MTSRFLIFAFLSIVSTASVTRATPAEDAEWGRAQTERTAEFIQRTLQAAQNTGCLTCADAESFAANNPQCRDTWTDFYSRDTLDFTYALGYMDDPTSDNRAQDGPVRAAIADQLVAPCTPARRGACGFRRSPDDAELFLKSMTGPDGREKTIRLHLVSSSVGINDSRNRQASTRTTCDQADARELLARSPMVRPDRIGQDQLCRSAHARAVYERALQNSDLLIYTGHGREETGPSFEPPVLNANRRVNYAYYHARPQGRPRLNSLLRSASRPPRLIGFFACFADRSFARDIRQSSPRTGVAASSGYTYFDALVSQGFATLDSTLAMRCEDDFTQNLRSIDIVDGYPVPTPSLNGFFRSGGSDQPTASNAASRGARTSGSRMRPIEPNDGDSRSLPTSNSPADE